MGSRNRNNGGGRLYSRNARFDLPEIDANELRFACLSNMIAGYGEGTNLDCVGLYAIAFQ